jgi:hypothetical protein
MGPAPAGPTPLSPEYRVPYSAAYKLPMMLAELTAASFETVWHRTALMMNGDCTAGEYERMLTEKMRAVQLSTAAMVNGDSLEAVLHPFHKRATANARRLRK